MKIDSILFDLDGTLWDSVDEIILTWNRIIAQEGCRKPITRPEQESLMGLQMDEIARRLFPAEPPQRQNALMAACMEEENRYLAQHGGRLYEGVAETLRKLAEKYPLCIVSNCQKGYIEAFLQAHKLGHLFTDHLSYGETLLTKGENNKLVIQRNGFQNPVYVGDTAGDRQSALDAGIPFVYAAYGFGTVAGWDAEIQTFSQLLDLF